MTKPASLSAKQAVLVVAKGAAMGAADVVPGVSGGTIAFITGIYERLIQAISHADISLIKHLVARDLASAWRHIDGTFLALLFLGIGGSIFSLAHIISHLLATGPLLVWSFFCGLVAASGVLLLRDIGRVNACLAGLLVAGVLAALAINILRPAQIEPSLGYVFFCGMIAICAMLLPGISGSFLLLVLGVYAFVLDAVKAFDVPVIVVFAMGAGIGLLGFAKILAFALARARAQMFAVLTGFLFGSLAMIWPWKIITQAQATNVLPSTYAQFYGEPSQWLSCAGLMTAAFALVAIMAKIGQK